MRGHDIGRAARTIKEGDHAYKKPKVLRRLVKQKGERISKKYNKSNGITLIKQLLSLFLKVLLSY